MSALTADPLCGRVLVVQTAYLGDLALTTALLRGLRLGPRPQRLDVLLGRPLQGLLDGSPHVDGVLVFDKRGEHRGLGGLIRLAREVRGRYDAALVAVRSMRSALLVAAARVPQRVGFSGPLGAALFHRCVGWDPSRPHAERLAALAPNVDWAGLGVRPELAVTPKESAAAAALLRDAGIDPGAPTVALHPGSAWQTKRWPAERFGAVARALAVDGMQSFVIGVESDVALGQRVQAEGGPRIANLCGRTGLGVLKALLSRTRLLLTNDSGPLHVAEALGTPVVAVFGSTRPSQGFAPWLPRSRVAEVELTCRPCGRHGRQRCPLGHFRCMLDLSVERVLQTVRSVLQSGRV
jgi:heptosyltransferase-2